MATLRYIGTNSLLAGIQGGIQGGIRGLLPHGSLMSPEFDETDLDWEKVLGYLRREFDRRLGRSAPSDVEDLAHEAALRFLRTLRRQPVRSPFGLLSLIARRVVADYLERRRRKHERLTPMGNGMLNISDNKTRPPDVPGNPVEWLELIVLEFFRTRRPGCRDLAQAYFQERDWRSVAEDLGITYEAVRARWSRCVETLRRGVKDDPTLRHLSYMAERD